MRKQTDDGRRRLLAAAMMLAACTAAQPALLAQGESAFVPVTDAMLQEPAPGDWLMWRRTLDGWGYSPLDGIDRDNVGDLRLVWSRALRPGGRQQGTPLVYDGVLYMPNPSDVIQAIDAATGDLLWEYQRPLPDDACERILPGVCTTNRNLAIYDDLIIDTSVDEFVFALDARTGELVWETEVLDYRTHPANQSTGPIVANGKVISGRSCMPAAGPDACVITAHDARTGAELWRRRTIPRPGEPGDETWGGVPDEERRHVGTWMAPSYDPELNLLYIGTSVTSPAPKFLVGGADNRHLYHNSTLALDADTGEIVWYYQHLNDHWDLDHPFERLLVDTAVRPDPAAVSWINPRLRPGEERRVVTGIPGKTGVVYTLDRATGEFLWATPTVTQNVISSIDGATGAVSEKPGAGLRRLRAGSADLSHRHGRQGLGGRGLQPADPHDVHAAAQRLRPDGGARRRQPVALQPQHAQRARPGHRPARRRVGDLGGDRRGGLDVRAARGHHVARGHRRGARLRGRHQRPLPRPRRRDRRGAVGGEPRIAGERLPDRLRRRRPAVRGGQHRHGRQRVALERAHPRVAAEQRQQHLRLRAALTDRGP